MGKKALLEQHHKVLQQIKEVRPNQLRKIQEVDTAVSKARASASSSASASEQPFIEELARRRAEGETLKQKAGEDAAAVKIAEAELQKAEATAHAIQAAAEERTDAYHRRSGTTTTKNQEIA